MKKIFAFASSNNEYDGDAPSWGKISITKKTLAAILRSKEILEENPFLKEVNFNFYSIQWGDFYGMHFKGNKAQTIESTFNVNKEGFYVFAFEKHSEFRWATERIPFDKLHEQSIPFHLT